MMLWVLAAWVVALGGTTILRRSLPDAAAFDEAAVSRVALVDHVHLLLYEPIHTAIRVRYRTVAIIRTLRSL